MVALIAGLMLLPTIEDMTFQETCCKKYAFVILGTYCFEIVFALLVKIRSLHM